MEALQLTFLSSPRCLFLPFAMNLVIFVKDGGYGSMQNWRKVEGVPQPHQIYPYTCPKAVALLTVPNSACPACLGSTYHPHLLWSPKNELRGSRTALPPPAGQQQQTWLPTGIHSSEDKNNSFWKWKGAKQAKKKA